MLFSTDIFHPLVSPLTTHTYSTDVQDNGTVSAADEERLPPGGFSLRHGFPDWFGRGRRTEPGARKASGETLASPGSDHTSAPLGSCSATSKKSSEAETVSYSKSGQPTVSIYSILKYIRSTFDTPEVLDSVPLAAAGNPGAWHAWRTHRRKSGKLFGQQSYPGQDAPSGEAHVPLASKDGDNSLSSASIVRRPGDWNWDGVWEDRVKRGVSASLGEPVLYGVSAIADDMVSQ